MHSAYALNNQYAHENPLDVLEESRCLIRFINESLGANNDSLELSGLGKDGLRFTLNFLEISMGKVQHLISRQINEKGRGFKKW